MITFDSFTEASKACPDDHVVCGTFAGEDPVYFTLPADVDPVQDASEAAFEVKHGRPMNKAERTITNVMAAEQNLDPSVITDTYPTSQVV